VSSNCILEHVENEKPGNFEISAGAVFINPRAARQCCNSLALKPGKTASIW